MFRPVSLFIGLRYVRSRKGQHFISAISLISIICFTLGVAALITVLSVMNGFDEQIRARVFSMAPHVTISSFDNAVGDWKGLTARLDQFPHVEAATPYISGQGMLTGNGQAHATLIFGIIPHLETTVSEINEKILQGKLEDLQPGKFGMILGQTLATSLGVGVGDKITLLTPTASATVLGMIPRYKRFTVVGIFSMGNGFGFDTNYAYINLRDAQILYQMGNFVSGIRLKLDDLYQAPAVAEDLQKAVLPTNYYAASWTETYGAFFQAIAMEKTIMFSLLVLIIVVAAFSLLATLFMVVTDKRADIAILRTIGTRPRTIMGIFMVQGMAIGALGTLCGLVAGISLALNVTKLTDIIQKTFNIRFLSSSVYYIDYLPSRIEVMDIVEVCVVAMLISAIATIIPSLLAAKVQPAEALRYE